MDIRPIRSEEDYNAALAEIDKLIDAVGGGPAADRLDVLGTLVAAYEDTHEPILAPDPIEAIKFRLEQEGLDRKALQKILGVERSRVSEILNRKRGLSLEMIRRLHRDLGIPAESLIQKTRPVKLHAKRSA